MASAAFKRTQNPKTETREPAPQDNNRKAHPGYDNDDEWWNDKKTKPGLMPWHHPAR